MADLEDVLSTLSAMAVAAVFPNGTSSPSVTGANVAVGEGWPVPAQLDATIAAGGANVSIYAPPGASQKVFQVLDEFYTLVPAVHGLSASIAGGTVTLAGTPGTGEYATIIADQRHAYSRVGASIAAILSAIEADAIGDYPSVSVNGDAITFPTTRLVVHIGAPATIGKVTHRQKQQFMVTVWAPNPAQRTILASAIDVAFKSFNRLTMPDTSQAILVHDHTNQIDRLETASIYRRDLVSTVEYATLMQYQAWEVTSFSPTIDPIPAGFGPSAAFTPAMG